MNKSELSEIFALLPEKDQEETIIYSLEVMFARSEWPLVNELLVHVMDLQGNEKLRTYALSIGVKTALRLREIDLAFERYQFLTELDKSGKNIGLQVETLLQMAIQILPARTDKLSTLWEQLISPDMPKEAQEIWAKIGVLLYQAISKNREEAKARAIKKIMRDYLPEPIWNRTRHKLAAA